MIVLVQMCGCKCDNCEKQWIDEHDGFVAFTDQNSIEINVQEDTDWETIGDKHYCPGCFSNWSVLKR